MGKIQFVSSCELSRKVVNKILCNAHNRVAVACKQVTLARPGALVLLTIATWEGHVYIFDIKRDPNIMTEGGLWRILQSPEIIKVMHDCRSTSSALMSQFNVTLSNVFDTQAAYSMVMMLRSLPPRFIHHHHLYQKFGDPAQLLDDKIKGSVQGEGIFWAQRPLSDAMVQSAATDVLVLLPTTYDNLKRELSPAQDKVLAELCHAYIHGEFKVKATSASGQTQKPILCLSKSQKYLLTNTVPQSAGELTYTS